MTDQRDRAQSDQTEIEAAWAAQNKEATEKWDELQTKWRSLITAEDMEYQNLLNEIAESSKDADYLFAVGQDYARRDLNKKQERATALSKAGARTRGERYSQAWHILHPNPEDKIDSGK